MNTAALLPTPVAVPRPQAGAPVGAEMPPTPDEGFAVALGASLDAAAEPALPAPLPTLLAQAVATPRPAALPALPEAAPAPDPSDAPEPLDPQSAFALAALGLLTLPVQPPVVAAPGPAADAAQPAGAPAPLPTATAMAVALPLAASAQPVEVHPDLAAAQQQARGLPAALPVAVETAQAADAADTVVAAPALARAGGAGLAADAAQQATDEMVREAARETARDAAPKAERAGAELPAAAPAPLRQAAASALPQPVVTLKGEATQWQQPLLQALGDRLQLQIAARSEQAVIRLEPPMLGRVEIAIRQQAGDLQVRIAASHDEVTRQIQQVGEQLRQSLVQRHSGEVSVQVLQQASAGREAEARGGAQQQAARDGQQQERQEQQQQRRPGRGLDGDDAAGFAADFAALKG